MKTTRKNDINIMIDTDTLKKAIYHNDISFLKSNLDTFDINTRFEAEDNDTLLLFAICLDSNETYKFFLQNGADVYATNNENENIIHAIVYSGDVERLEFVMEQYRSININETTKDGATPLLLSVALGEHDIAKALIIHGADVNIADKEGLTPLHIACQEGFTDLAELLIKRGANIRVKTIKGNYPIMLAIANDHEELSKILFSKHF